MNESTNKRRTQTKTQRDTMVDISQTSTPSRSCQFRNWLVEKFMNLQHNKEMYILQTVSISMCFLWLQYLFNPFEYNMIVKALFDSSNCRFSLGMNFIIITDNSYHRSVTFVYFYVILHCCELYIWFDLLFSKHTFQFHYLEFCRAKLVTIYLLFVKLFFK